MNVLNVHAQISGVNGMGIVIIASEYTGILVDTFQDVFNLC